MSKNAHSRKVSIRSQFPIIAFVVGLALAIIFGGISWRALQSRMSNTGAQAGQVAPDFTVPTLDGATFTLSEQRGNPTIIFFTAYWCGSCIPKAQELGQLYQEYKGRVTIIALDIDPTSTPELLDRFKQAAGNGAFVWALDSGSKVATAYRVNSLSTAIILDGAGRIVYRGQFPTSYAALKAELEKLHP